MSYFVIEGTQDFLSWHNNHDHGDHGHHPPDPITDIKNIGKCPVLGQSVAGMQPGLGGVAFG